MIYRSLENRGKIRVREAGCEALMSQGRDHVDRSDGIFEGYDSFGGP